jgi:hypothetical protein
MMRPQGAEASGLLNVDQFGQQQQEYVRHAGAVNDQADENKEE